MSSTKQCFIRNDPVIYLCTVVAHLALPSRLAEEPPRLVGLPYWWVVVPSELVERWASQTGGPVGLPNWWAGWAPKLVGRWASQTGRPPQLVG